MRITICFIGVALMALASPAMAAPCTPAQRADLAKLGYEQADIKKMCGNASALFERAYSAKESGDLRIAQQLFEQGLLIEPGNALGQKLLAEVKESLSGAQKLFEQGYNAKQSGDLQSAQQLFEQGLRKEPGNALGQQYLAEVKESLSSAQKLFEQGYNAKQSGDLRTAQQLFEQGLKIEPGNELGQKYLAEVTTAARGPAIDTFDCVRSDNPRITTTLVVDFTSSSVKSLNGFGGIGAGVRAQITDATISWRNQVIKNYGGGGVLDFSGSIDRATRNFSFKGSDNSTYIFKCR